MAAQPLGTLSWSGEGLQVGLPWVQVPVLPLARL